MLSETPHLDCNNLNKIADQLRLKIIDMAANGGGGHLGGSFSVLEILVTLYLGKILKYKPLDPSWSHRDILLFSKGHSCMALYAVLSEAGYFESKELENYCKQDSKFAGHPEHDLLEGVEITSGSLGHGPPIANGLALAAKLNGTNQKLFCIVGDGECNEGSVWEAFMAASQFKLDNLTLIIDSNKLESLDLVSNILSIEPLAERLKSFGFAVKEINGNDTHQLMAAFSTLPFKSSKPSAIIAHTIKGKGVDFMEGVPKWHHRKLTVQEAADARSQIIARINNA
jgi:transketolase